MIDKDRLAATALRVRELTKSRDDIQQCLNRADKAVARIVASLNDVTLGLAEARNALDELVYGPTKMEI